MGEQPALRCRLRGEDVALGPKTTGSLWGVLVVLAVFAGFWGGWVHLAIRASGNPAIQAQRVPLVVLATLFGVAFGGFIMLVAWRRARDVRAVGEVLVFDVTKRVLLLPRHKRQLNRSDVVAVELLEGRAGWGSSTKPLEQLAIAYRDERGWRRMSVHTCRWTSLRPLQEWSRVAGVPLRRYGVRAGQAYGELFLYEPLYSPSFDRPAEERYSPDVRTRGLLGLTHQGVPPTCRSCGYSLEGLALGSRCPECGKPSVVREDIG